MGSNPIFDTMNTKIKDNIFNINLFIPIIYKKTNSILTLKKDIINVLDFFKLNIYLKTNMLLYTTGVDLLNKIKRFYIIYELFSYMNNNRHQIKIFNNNKEKINSLTIFFSSNNWHERELWDLFGIFIKNHPDLRRIVTDYTFEGFPLRKDFPLTGFIENLFLDIYGGLYNIPVLISV